MRGPSIRLDNVGLVLGGTQILKDINLSIAPGEIHCVIGPNGGGKTSLIRCLLGQMPHSGTISIAWNDGRATGYVPQFLDFDKTLPVSVADFMAMVCHKHRPAFLGMNRKNRARADAALDRVGLSGKRRRKLGSLSGGERQRVLFAQALIPEPSLLVLDEPMTSMDEVGAEIFAKLINDLAAEGVTIVWIAHDLAQVNEMAGAVSFIDQTLLFSGPPAEVLAGRQAAALFNDASIATATHARTTA